MCVCVCAFFSLKILVQGSEGVNIMLLVNKFLDLEMYTTSKSGLVQRSGDCVLAAYWCCVAANRVLKC